MKDKKRTIVDPEPTWGDKPSHSITEALSWYSSHKEDKDAAKYLGVKEITVAKNFSTLAWTKRMSSLGCVFTEKQKQTIAEMQAKFDSYVGAIKPTAQPSTTNVISIQERFFAYRLWIQCRLKFSHLLCKLLPVVAEGVDHMPSQADLATGDISGSLD
jgi:hypothetical protein